ncbi:hypothetical protein [Fundicoccus culcitae]|uniref:Uncharacterized protein n=1 Tax=Fundicoccus culcitae TaxID=2969821 RepID=A0ABY5P9S6_9LACT|nr:hypothetical protein [Fundicoccus culcitae]UUX35419.1 hypothetical protein NRE15_07180 [Fundicoccus culcitae]
MPDLIPQRRPPNPFTGRLLKMSSAFLTCFIENKLIHPIAGSHSATTSAKPTCRTSVENVVRLFNLFYRKLPNSSHCRISFHIDVRQTYLPDVS